jgi:hypothetical protein
MQSTAARMRETHARWEVTTRHAPRVYRARRDSATGTHVVKMAA